MQLRMSCNKLKADVARQQHPEGGLASPDYRVASYGEQAERDVAERLYYLWLGTNECLPATASPEYR
jgi:hypothetical protein